MRKFCLSLAFLLPIITLNLSPLLALKLEDGTTFFTKSPRLINLVTTFDQVRQWGAKYYLTINIPEDVGELLGKITITRTSGGENIDFNLSKTTAFFGTKDNKGNPIIVKSNLIEQNHNTQTIAVEFPHGINPSSVFSVVFKPIRNPSLTGYYSFRVKAFPLGEKPYPLDLGVRSLYFSDRGNFGW